MSRRRRSSPPSRSTSGLWPELAPRSMVLVENDGILPLAPGPGRIAVIGPIADSARDLLGDYAHVLISRRWPRCATAPPVRLPGQATSSSRSTS